MSQERIEITNPNPRMVMLIYPGQKQPELTFRKGDCYDVPFVAGMKLEAEATVIMILKDTTYGEDGDIWKMEIPNGKAKSVKRPFDK